MSGSKTSAQGRADSYRTGAEREEVEVVQKPWLSEPATFWLSEFVLVVGSAYGIAGTIYLSQHVGAFTAWAIGIPVVIGSIAAGIVAFARFVTRGDP